MSERAQQMHASPWLGVFYVTGGGAGLLAELLNTPGASKSVLEATVPYAGESLARLLGRAPDQACSPVTARQLAITAFEQAQALQQAPQSGQMLFGFGLTASLATDRTKKGTHRAHWAIQTLSDTYTFTVTYDANLDRAAEEAALLEQIWNTLSHCLLDPSTAVDDSLVELHARATPDLQGLLHQPPYRHCIGQHDGMLLLPGSFNPLHEGHRQMLKVAERITDIAGAFELAVRNADKPGLDFVSISERTAGIGDKPVWLTNTPTFEGKASLFPGATFALGVDTLERIGQLRFYRNHPDLLERALQTFDVQNIRFVVFGRQIDGAFKTLADLEIPQALHDRCVAVSEADYRNDSSSTEIRARRS